MPAPPTKVMRGRTAIRSPRLHMLVINWWFPASANQTLETEIAAQAFSKAGTTFPMPEASEC